MKQLLTKATVFMISFIFCFNVAKAQDIIIKIDKSEIKSKVTEISETTIKYKKWDNLEGPIYSISKTEVFLIAYANGQREIIKQSTQVSLTSPQSTPPKSNPSSGNSLENQIKMQTQQQSVISGMDTTIDYKNIKVKYKPLRLLVGLTKPLTIEFNYEYRIIKNSLNIGAALTSYTGNLSSVFYVSGYAPINRLIGNYKDQDLGLFIFAQPAVAFPKYGPIFFTWRVGADYFFSKFGITLSTYEFKSVYTGVAYSF